MENGFAAQGADYLNGIHPLPNQMAGIQVGADLGTNRFTEFFQGVGVVDTEALVHLQSNLIDTVRFGKGHKVLPIGNQHFVPLPVQNFQILRGPCAHHPVGVLALGAVAGTAGETVDLMQAQLFSHQNRVVHIVVKLLGHLLVGMDGIAMAAEGADFQAGILDSLHKLLEFRLIVEQHLGIAVIFAGITTTADLHHLGAKRFKIGQSLRQRGLADHIGKHT